MALKAALIAALSCCLPAVVNAAQQAQTVTTTDLKTKPEPKAETVASLPAGSMLQINDRQGGWYAAETSQGKGWVRLLHVRLAGGSSKPGKNGVDTLVKLGSTSRTDTTVATGIRGLTAEDLKQAKENPRELAKLDQFAVSDADARQFAAQGGVSSRTVGKE
ncbi:hypothetical protein HPT27_11270 [Permianibacter sp. IMCC34836]|uniref:hypothetical protein n=1 Tax=Permianibacter fluminis TaxID=2738515 RepID=UPI0015535AA8|nr:hypothetical protein [Permianibacter fluminis]NQD37606.1 hypothetical protein [Permianibacter fluminis]